MKKIIYKFFRVNSYLYDVLISNQLYFSSIRQFNDPYDCHMAVLNEITEKEFDHYLKSVFKTKKARDRYLEAFKKNPKGFAEPFIEAYRNLL